MTKSDKNKKILVATNINFWEKNIGAHERIYNMLSSLCSNGFSISIFYTGEPRKLRQNACCLFPIFSSKLLVKDIKSTTKSYLRAVGWLKDFSSLIVNILRYQSIHQPNNGSWKSNISECDRYVGSSPNQVGRLA